MAQTNYFANIFNASPLPSLLLKPDAPLFTIEEANTAYLKITGTTQQDLAGKGIFEAFPDNPNNPKADGVKNLNASLQTVIKTKLAHKMATQRYDIPIRGTQLFSERYYAPENVPVFNSEGGMVLIMHTVTDITEKILLEKKQVLMEEQASAISAELEHLKKTSETGSWEFDIETGKMYWSEEYCSMCSLQAGSLTPSLDKHFELVHPDDRANAKASFYAAAETGTSYRSEQRLNNGDGTIFQVLLTVAVIKNQQGKPIKLTGLVQNITGSRQMEKMLRQTVDMLNRRNNFIETILHNLPVGIAVNKISNGKPTLVNKHFTDIYGWTAQDMDDIEGFLEKVYPDKAYRETLAAQVLADILSGDAARMQWKGLQITTNTGEKRIVDAKTILLPDQDVMISTRLDVTDRENVLRQLNESNLRYHYLTKATSDAVWDWDIPQQTLIWGEGYATVFGYKPDETSTNISSWAKHIHPRDKDRVISGIYAFVNGTQTNWEEQYRYYKADGTMAYVVDKGFVIRDEHGKATRMVGGMRDITLRKEEELRIKLLQSVVTNTNDAVLITEAEPFDEPGPRIIYVNEAFTKMTGYSAEEVMGKTPRILQGPNSDYAALAKLGTALRKWQPCELTVVNYKKNGEEFWLDMSISPVADETGWYTHWIAIERDVTEQKLTEIKLREAAIQQALFVSIVNSSDDAIISKTLGGIVTSWNHGAEKLFGYLADEIIGQHIMKIIPEAFISQEQEIIDRIVLGEFVRHFETERVKKDGTHISVSLTVSPIKDEKGLIIGASKIARDITEKKKAEDAIRLSNERYNLVAMATNDSISDWDLITNKVTRTGTGFKKLYGHDLLELEDHRELRLKLIHPQDVERFSEKQQQIFNNPNEFYWEDEFRLLKADGNYAYVHAKGYIVRDPTGKAVRMIGATRDLTKQTEQLIEIRRIQRNLHSLINNTRDMIWSINTDLKIITANKAYSDSIAQITHQATQEGDDALPKELHEDAATKWLQLYKRAFAGEAFSEETTNIHPATGDVSYKIVSLSPIINRTGIITGIACYAKDITALKKATAKVEEINRDLQKKANELALSNAELEQFAYVASHDLQEPLRMVTSFLTQLEKKYVGVIDDKGKQYINFAVDGAKRMRQIILDLLEFSRVGRGDEYKENIDLNELLAEVKILSRKTIEEKKAVIHFGHLPVIYNFKSPIRQVFQNLVSNGLKYCSKQVQPVIAIAATEFNTHWQFAVTDNGIGINEEYFDKIFIIFQRLHNKDDYSGTGMGLAISKKIIENLGGKIWVNSTEGQGSTFYFTIPKTE